MINKATNFFVDSFMSVGLLLLFMELEKILDISLDITAQLSLMGLSVREIEAWFDKPIPAYAGLTPAEYIAVLGLEKGPEKVYRDLHDLYYVVSCC